jgi:hypothetical protein
MYVRYMYEGQLKTTRKISEFHKRHPKELFVIICVWTVKWFCKFVQKQWEYCFSTMKVKTSTQWTNVTDENLTSVIRMTCTNIAPGLKRLAFAVDDHVTKILLVFISTPLRLHSILYFSDNIYYENNL